jgi:ribosomal protein L12E/L44/L45/RPP1/RPP2
METTDAFRARFEENYFQLLVKKGVDPSTARARAKAKAVALPARIETPAAAPAPAPAAPPAPAPAPPKPTIKREAPSSEEESEDDGDESDDDAVPLASRSVDELKAICRRRNLRVGGKKAELVQRIVDDDGGVREPSKKKRRVRKRNWGRGSMSGQQLGAMASAMRVVLPEQLPTPALVSREAPAQRADHVCTCLSGHPDRCSAPVHLCACCTGNFAACRATAHNCNCTTMISLLSSTAIPCRTVWKDPVTETRSRRWRGASEILFPHRCRAHVHRCRCDNPSHKCLSRVHKCICGTVLGKCLKHPSRKK